ncbi:hypothetical protein [Siccirubricoccus phaeus]|uniref:hypothetical protein n=1 Tax=Siccirubricoccus phaeus TaxID=2595053 RepID=UPI0011F3EB19|nr:hypothetical protein [Siccirubricoccus phaeus]
MPETDNQEDVRETRLRIARHLAELHRLHLVLVNESRALKRFTLDGRARVEIDIAAEMIEQYMGSSDAFLENLRGRFESRLGLLRRGEPKVNNHAEDAPGHGAFWLAFSRLCAVLRRAGSRVNGTVGG